jgi:hypothetical protein
MPIRRSPDCAALGTEGWFCMERASSIKLSDAEKLHVLRKLDEFWEWHFLDEKRYCLVCGEIITGREIKMIENRCGGLPPRLICPTEHCDSVPMEWVPPTEEVLIKIAMVDAERRWLRLIARAGRAMQSYERRRDKGINRTTPKPRLG